MQKILYKEKQALSSKQNDVEMLIEQFATSLKLKFLNPLGNEASD